MKPPNMTLETLYAEFEKYSVPLGECQAEERLGKTTAEWAKELGISIKRMRQILRKAKEAKILVMNKYRRESLDGSFLAIPHYYFKEKKKPKYCGTENDR